MLNREIAIWDDYYLADSGDGEKREFFGDVSMLRPDPQALWAKNLPDQIADLVYSRQGREGEWTYHGQVPKNWTIGWEDLKFNIRPTSFKHTGLFPEQACNWQYLRRNLNSSHKVLNLFGYTGGATIAAASVGCEVTHVDASKPVVTWGKENAALSGLGERPIKWIVDDVSKFIARELRRGNVYDAILMDPPAFGRGPEGELWKFEEHLPSLIKDCRQLLNPAGGLLLVNAYSLGYPALAIENLVRASLPWTVQIESAELTLKERTPRGFLLPTGVVVRATWG